MLIDFFVSNFLSFNDKTSFSMESGRATKKEEHLMQNDVLQKPLLKFAAMFGKNGAGKTNFIRAISFVQNFIVRGILPKNASELWCQVFEENENKESSFEISFLTEGQIYIYSLSLVLNQRLITKEKLIKKTGNRHTILFERSPQGDSYTFHHSLKGNRNDIEVLSSTYALSGKPFLFSINHGTAGFYQKNPQALPLSKVFLWFKDTLEVIFPDQPLQETSLLRYDVCKDEFAKFLKDFDTGICGIELEPVTKEKVFENLEERLRRQIDMEMGLFLQVIQVPAQLLQLKLIQHLKVEKESNIYSQVIRNRRNIFIITYETDNAFHFYALKFVHDFNGRKIKFSMENESDGTHRLFQLLEILVGQKQKTYIFDEINRSLHPKLSVEFIKKYFEMIKKTGRNIQLITTTHESRLLSHDLVRRDEIWIADSNKDVSTTLYSLEQKQVRIDKVLDQNYINNVWGGVPVFEDEES